MLSARRLLFVLMASTWIPACSSSSGSTANASGPTDAAAGNDGSGLGIPSSDGGVQELGSGNPHPRSYGTNARVLGEYVRVRGVLTVEDAIRRMTGLPARTFRLQDRGLVREGMAADLVVFDPARVEDKATFAKPHQYSQGFDFVLVNGKIVVDGGKLTAVRPGKALRRSE